MKEEKIRERMMKEERVRSEEARNLKILQLVDQIDQQSIFADFAALKALTDSDQPYTRRAFTDQYLAGRAWLVERLSALGLTPYYDAIGNLRARLEGERAETIYFGSHTDTVPGGGLYDGILGVIAGISVLQSIITSGAKPQYSLELIDFLAEESSDWGLSCIGSRGLAGVLHDQDLARKNPYTDEVLADAIVKMGGEAPFQSDLLSPKSGSCFVELHIEQGPLLEALDQEVGIVSGIVGIDRVELNISGKQNHSGTTPMTLREDALVGASALITRIHQLATEIAAEAALEEGYFVATCGRLITTPNAINVVPGAAQLVVDIRFSRTQYRDRFLEALKEQQSHIEKQYQLSSKLTRLSTTEPVLFDRALQTQATSWAERLGYRSHSLLSGAGHDAAFMAMLMPTVMLFIPSVDGLSHHAQELSHEADIIRGISLFSALILDLAL